MKENKRKKSGKSPPKKKKKKTFAFENNEMKELFYYVSACIQLKYVSILYGEIYQTKEFL
jgi:hypothetical protein